MAPVTRHYDELLAEHYTWMIGLPLAAKVAEQRALLEDLGVGRGGLSLAFDLGSGPGFQSLALAEIGFARVVAIDTSRTLLDELLQARRELPIEAIQADLRAFSSLAEPDSADMIVCMGDTLPHLETREDVSHLLAAAYAILAPGGLLILTFRDLSGELIGLDRFLPVRADADRIMTCVLEYEPESVIVNDLIHVRQGTSWEFHKSSYRKLRLGAAAIADELARLGFLIEHKGMAGRMNAIVARKVSHQGPGLG
jgi:SAM-dependent methyltransferase